MLSLLENEWVVSKEIIVKNRRASFDYEILEVLETGMALRGSEVKALRARHVRIEESYVLIEGGELYLRQLYIGPYEMANIQNHDPLRRRKLLARKREIASLAQQVERKGLTMVVLELYFKRGLAKALIAVGRGKKVADKRETIKKRDAEREIQRQMKKDS